MSLKICTDISNGFNNAFNYITLKGVRYIEEKKLSELKYQLADYEKENARLKENIERAKDTANSFLKSNKKIKKENFRLREALEKISKMEVRVGLYLEPSLEANMALKALQGEEE